MSKKRLSMILFGVFIVLVIGAMFWGKQHDNTTDVEVLSFPNPEEVKEEVEAKVEEVKEAVEEKAEEIIEEVEQIKEMLPEIPAIPEIEEAPAPTLEEVPEEPTNDSL